MDEEILTQEINALRQESKHVLQYYYDLCAIINGKSSELMQVCKHEWRYDHGQYDGTRWQHCIKCNNIK